MTRKSKFLTDAGVSQEALDMLKGRIRRRTMHAVTRHMNAVTYTSLSDSPKGHWELFLREVVQQKLTEVLGEEIG